MSGDINKKLSEILGKADDAVTRAKLNKALEMLKQGDTEELAKKINKLDKNELMEKINDFDVSMLKQLKIDKNALKDKLKAEDFEKLSALIGNNGEEITKKIRDILDQ